MASEDLNKCVEALLQKRSKLTPNLKVTQYRDTINPISDTENEDLETSVSKEQP